MELLRSLNDLNSAESAAIKMRDSQVILSLDDHH